MLLQTHDYCHQFHVCAKHDRFLVHAAGCTRLDLSQPLSRLGRYLNDWAEKELKHIMEDVKHTIAYNLTFIIYGNDVW